MVYILLFTVILLLIILLLTIGVDLWLYSTSMLKRYKIGRWKATNSWYVAMQNTNKKWLQNTPTVKLTDNESYVIFDLIKGHYRSKTIQSWQEAGSLIGAVYTQNCEHEINSFIKKKIDFNTGKWFQIPSHIDGAILAYAISRTNTDPHTIKPAYDEIIDLIKSCIGKDGTVFYRDYIPNIRFVDTIGFICPFLTFYAQTFNKPEYIDLAFKQIDDYVDKAFLKDSFLPAHAFDIDKNIPLGVYGWGRGLGWFIIGVVDMYNELDKNHPKKEYLKNIIIQTAKSTLLFQKSDGGFNAMMSVNMSRQDSSITTIAGWLFLNAFQLTNEKKYLDAAHNTINALMKVTRRNGAIDFCQGDTKGIGIYASTFDIMPFVQGLTIRFVTSSNILEKVKP